MIDALAQSFNWIQGALMLVAGVVLMAVERRWPRRSTLVVSMLRRRWQTNLGLLGLGLLLIACVGESLQMAAVRMGSFAGGGGLAALAMPDALKVLLGVMLADAIQYGLHRISHAIPLLWQLHQVHHADEQVDVSTSVRHHPLEMLALFGLNFMLCVALGVPLLSLMLYLLLATLLSLFCHANWALPSAVDRVLRWVIVTPDMHRVHHGARLDEGNSNFGMAFPWWDRLFHSYHAQPQAGHAAMDLGLVAPASSGQGLWRSLTLPFLRAKP